MNIVGICEQKKKKKKKKGKREQNRGAEFSLRSPTTVASDGNRGNNNSLVMSPGPHPMSRHLPRIFDNSPLNSSTTSRASRRCIACALRYCSRSMSDVRSMNLWRLNYARLRLRFLALLLIRRSIIWEQNCCAEIVMIKGSSRNYAILNVLGLMNKLISSNSKIVYRIFDRNNRYFGANGYFEYSRCGIVYWIILTFREITTILWKKRKKQKNKFIIDSRENWQLLTDRLNHSFTIIWVFFWGTRKQLFCQIWLNSGLFLPSSHPLLIHFGNFPTMRERAEHPYRTCSHC